MLCEKCRNIHFQPLRDCELIKQEPSRLDIPNTVQDVSDCVFYFHHKDRNDLEASAESGCHFCAMLLDRLYGLQASRHFASKYSFARGEVIFRRSIIDQWLEEENGFKNWSLYDWIYIQCDENSITTSSFPDYPKPMEMMIDALTSSANIHPSPAGQIISQNSTTGTIENQLQLMLPDILPINSRNLWSPWLDIATISLPNMALASLWLQFCLKNHKPCSGTQKESILPDRVLDITDPGRPILSEGKGCSAQYVTLSYKWGAARKYTTTTENLNNHSKVGVPLNLLPWTFRDAVYVSHTLGFQWLWIDALCIIQDSKEDRIHEIERMDQIFRSSTLTLFAAAGDDADSGLSASRDPRWVKPCKLNIKTSIEGESAEGTVNILIDGGDWSMTPLYERGWVLQEEVLATRALIFESRQLRWRCLCGTSSESDPGRTCRKPIDTVKELGSVQYDKWRDYSGGFDGYDLLRMWIQHPNPVPDRTPWQRENQFDHWYSLIEKYSQRVLSYDSDVLRALSGLAKAMAKTHNCTYLSGLWKEDLQVGLCWYVTDKYPDSLRFSLSAHDVHHAHDTPMPSWSWASRWGQRLRFRGWENNHIRAIHEGVMLFDDIVHNQNQPLDPYIAVSQKSLTLTGRVRTAVVEEIDRSWDSSRYESGNSTLGDFKSARWGALIKDPCSGGKLGHIAFDSNPKHMEIRLIHCLLCAAREKYGKWNISCLALVPTNESMEEFRRIGLVSLSDSKWFGHLQLVNPEVSKSSDSMLFRAKESSRYTRTIRIV